MSIQEGNGYELLWEHCMWESGNYIFGAGQFFLTDDFRMLAHHHIGPIRREVAWDAEAPFQDATVHKYLK